MVWVSDPNSFDKSEIKITLTSCVDDIAVTRNTDKQDTVPKSKITSANTFPGAPLMASNNCYIVLVACVTKIYQLSVTINITLQLENFPSLKNPFHKLLKHLIFSYK